MSQNFKLINRILTFIVPHFQSSIRHGTIYLTLMPPTTAKSFDSTV